jgi:hypothetical protein
MLRKIIRGPNKVEAFLTYLEIFGFVALLVAAVY